MLSVADPKACLSRTVKKMPNSMGQSATLRYPTVDVERLPCRVCDIEAVLSGLFCSVHFSCNRLSEKAMLTVDLLALNPHCDSR